MPNPRPLAAPAHPPDPAVGVEVESVAPEVLENLGAGLDVLAEADRSNRIGRTLQQVAPVSAFVGFIGYVLTFTDVDYAPLDPDSRSVPEWVVSLVVTIGTWLAARRMNRPPS